MDVMVQGRGAGKTTELIRLCANTPGSCLVCAELSHCVEAVEMAETMGLKIPTLMTFDEFIDGRFRGKHITAFYIDNVDMLLLRLARGVNIPVVACTGTYRPLTIKGDGEAYTL